MLEEPSSFVCGFEVADLSYLPLQKTLFAAGKHLSVRFDTCDAWAFFFISFGLITYVVFVGRYAVFVPIR